MINTKGGTPMSASSSRKKANSSRLRDLTGCYFILKLDSADRKIVVVV
jgi:hypothetical protein